jgi:autotransporter-associated beta strand protein
MKPKSSFRSFLALAGSSLLAMSSASAVTYTWTQAGTGSQTWGTTTNWLGSNVFVSGSANELAFFTGVTPVAGVTITVDSLPSTLSMNVLTLAGTGPNSTLGSDITIGTSASTWTIGDGTTSTVNLTSLGGGANADREIRYNVVANLTLNQTTTTFTGSGTALSGYKFSGNITGAAGYGITKSGTSTLVFSGNNSYNGTTTVSAGTLRLNSATALSGGIGATGGTSALTISGTGVVELGAGNFQRNLGTGSDQFQILGTTSGFSAFGGPRVITVNNDATQELVWGSASFNPTTALLLNAATANDSLELTNKIDLAGSARTFQVNANKALLSGVIRNGNLVKTGTGTLVLTGSNTYGGNNTLTGGTLSISAADNVGTTGNISFNGGSLQIRGTTLTSFSSIGSHNVTFSANNTGIDIQDAANIFTADEAINLGNKAFTKLGAGTLVLNFDSNHGGGAASTTSVSGGGTLVLDYSTNNGSKLADSSGAVTLGGTNLILRGGSHAEIVASIALTANTGNSISRDGSSTATLANAGALTTAALSNLNIAEAGIVKTTSANVNGIQTLGRVTVGSDFAAKDVSNFLQAYSGYTPYTAGSGAGSALTVVNQLNGGGTMSSDLLSYSLKIVNSGDDNVLNMNTGVDLHVSNGGTILYGGASLTNNNYTINGDGYLGSASGNQAFNLNVFIGTLTANAKLTSGGSSSFAKSGVGTLVAGGTNTYNGATYVQQGILRVANDAGLGAVSTGTFGTFVQGGAALELSQTTALTPLDITIGAEALSINGVGISNGGALRNHSGSNIYDGLITIGASGARINANASSTLTLRGGIATTLVQDVTFGGDGNTTVSTTAITGSGNVIKDGSGTLTLSATNTYTGATTVTNGSLIVNGNTSSSILTTVSGTGSLGGSGTVGALTIASGGSHNPGNSPGIMNTGDYIMAGTLNIEAIGNTAGIGGYDQINVTGTVTLSGILATSITSGSYVNGDLLFILLNDGGDAIAGSFSNFNQGDVVANYSGLDWTISYVADSTGNAFTGGNDIALLAVATIPEPRAAMLGAIGLLALLRRRR